ncbi:MAG: hypothetical protein WA400_17690 [Silvibacterium sp.]
MTFVDSLLEKVARPVPFRVRILRRILRRWPIGSCEARLNAGAVDRPHYFWCVYHAAVEAKALGYKAITVAEFGVAGGNGLVCLLQQRKEIEKEVGVEIVVTGFDAGSGLPASNDPRDLLYCWPAGSFVMDRAALERRINGAAELILGDVKTTITAWEIRADAPLGAILFDLDMYTSTMNAFAIFDKTNVLPRVWCYFDDICGGPQNATANRTGEREAIRQFSLGPERSLRNDYLSPAYTFRGVPAEQWHEHIYLYHRLGHPEYNRCLAKREEQQLPLVAV